MVFTQEPTQEGHLFIQSWFCAAGICWSLEHWTVALDFKAKSTASVQTEVTAEGMPKLGKIKSSLFGS